MLFRPKLSRKPRSDSSKRFHGVCIHERPFHITDDSKYKKKMDQCAKETYISITNERVGPNLDGGGPAQRGLVSRGGGR